MAWAPDYITGPDLKDYLRIQHDDDDVFLALAATASSRAIDRHTHRQFGSVAAEERTYEPRYDYGRCRWVVDVDDFMSAVGLVVTVDGTVTTAFTKEPVNAAQKSRPWTRLAFDYGAAVVPVAPNYLVTVTAPWGWTAVPDTVTMAAYLQGNRLHSRRDAPFGVAGSPDSGSEIRLLARLDPDVAVTLTDFVRPLRVR